MKIANKIAGLFLLVGTACTTEPLGPDYGAADSSARTPITIELGLSATDAGVRTRAGEFDLEDVFRSTDIESVWVGVFDVQTGEIVGQTHSDRPKGLSATIDVLYYDTHPTIRIFGVANYKGIVGSNGAKTDYLENLLGDVEKLDDFFALSVDTASADAVQKSTGVPLMMGAYEADLYTIKLERGEFVPSSSAADITLNNAHEQVAAGESGDNMYKRIRLNGEIHLRRLLSQITVNVNGAEGVTVSNLRYRFVNMPQEVYLQERTTYTAQVKSLDAWKEQSPNKADSYLDGKNGKIIAASKYASSDLQEADGTNFIYHHYENKHWGFNVSTQDEREAISTDQSPMGVPIFLALNPLDGGDSANDYNNFASYFEITAYVEVAGPGLTPQSGEVTYRIHEGFCNDASGSDKTVAEKDKALDFTCVRNTAYVYNITVKGLKSIQVDASLENSNNGVLGGELWTKENVVNINEASNGSSENSLDFTGKKMQSFLYYYANGDGTPIYYGNSDLTQLQIPGLDLTGADYRPDLAAEYGFKFGSAFDQGIEDIMTASSLSGNMPVKVIKAETTEGNPAKKLQTLVILHEEKASADGTRKNYSYSCITYLPSDTRPDDMQIASISLAFANDWGGAAVPENAAVAGHTSEVRIASLEWENKPADANPEYTIYLDGKYVYSGSSVSAPNLWNGKAYQGNSVHTVKVVASDPDKYKDCECEARFIAVPTTLDWTVPATAFNSGDPFSGSYSYDAGIAGSGFYQFRILSDIDANTSTSGLRALGARDIFELEVPYDAVLTIETTGTKGSDVPNYTAGDSPEKILRMLIVEDESGVPQRSFASSPKNYPVESSFFVRKGKVKVSSSETFDIYSVHLAYHDPEASVNKSWNFANAEWAGVLKSLSYFYSNGLELSNFTVSVNGLHIESGTSYLRSDGSTYLDLAGGGNVQNMTRVMWFYAHKPGKVTVNLVKNDSGRTLGCYVEGQGEVATFPTTGTDQSCEISVEEPTKVYLYSTGSGIQVNKVEFEEY